MVRGGVAPARRLALALVLVLAGCSARLGAGLGDHAGDLTLDLSGDGESLLIRAQAAFDDRGGSSENQHALVLAHRAAMLRPDSAEAWHLAGRACGWLWEYGIVPYVARPDGTGVEEADCVLLASRAVDLSPDEPRFLYGLAVNTGLDFERASVIGKPFRVNPFVELVRRLVALEDSLDDGGPLRMLGAVYLKAPAWPVGPGDLDASLELLEEAVRRFPEHPLNHLFYAEALLADGRRDEGLAHLDLAAVLSAPERVGWRSRHYLRRVERAR